MQPQPTGQEPKRKQVAVDDYESVRARRGLAMVAWIAFGVLVAAGIVVAALLLRPDMADEHPGDDVALPLPAKENGTPPVASASEVPVAAPDVAQDTTDVATPGPADPALASVVVVRLRVGPDFAPARGSEIVAALKAAGIPEVKVESLPFKITSSRIGYYRTADLQAAQALGRVMSPIVAPEASPLGVRDYGRLLADPEPGRLDLWIGN